MPWFYCSLCCDTIKKPKIAGHARGCRGAEYTCIDCSSTFSLQEVQGHTACVTEEQKYIECATKPGGFAVKGFVGAKAPQSTSDVVGAEYLSSGPQWRCSICKVSCTSEATLLSHATGQKHQRRCRAASAAGAEKASPGAEKSSDTVCEVKEPESAAKDAGKRVLGESDVSSDARQKKPKVEKGTDIPQLVVQAVSKKGGNAKLHKVLQMVTKKLAKRDADSADKDDTLGKVLAADGAGFEVIVRLTGEE